MIAAAQPAAPATGLGEAQWLTRKLVEKPWGVDKLPPPFATLAGAAGKRIGEVWFEPPEALPQLLIKHIFTSEKLSVQVHPTDAQAEAAGLGRHGKEECWLITAAQPGATLGIGFDRSLSAEAMRAAARDGSIEALMHWYPVVPGDFFMIPANTVHAIGAGIGLIEIQQNSDITYRLFDYGRPRELHLDVGAAVADGAPYDSARFHRTNMDRAATTPLVNGPFFRLDIVGGPPTADLANAYADGPLLLVPLAGDIRVAGRSASPGECVLVPALADVASATDACALLTKPTAANG